MTTFEPINRNHPNGTVTPFSISHESNEQKNYVKSLVDMVAHTINTIWPQPVPKNTTTNNNNTASLMTFLQHILKHSRTTHSTLQLALFYLFRIRPRMATILDQLPMKDRPYVLCGRRMFLASLISAHKYLQDKTYKNKAWTQISGLPVEQINHAERIFLCLLDYQLYIKKDTYDHWLKLVQHQIGQPCPPSSMTTPPAMKHPIHEKKNQQQLSIDILSTPSLDKTPSSIHSSDNDFCSTPITPIMNNDPSLHHHHSDNSSNKKRKMDLDTIMTTTTTTTTTVDVSTIHRIPSPKELNQLPTPPSESDHSLPSFSTAEKRKWSAYLQQ
ncbi:unnamed protein product [Cunninghamella blakesleeana]